MTDFVRHQMTENKPTACRVSPPFGHLFRPMEEDGCEKTELSVAERKSVTEFFKSGR